MACLKLYLSCLVILGAPIFVFCGECCRAHYDILFSYNEEKWCSNYCCFQLGKYDCCDNFLLQAPSIERKDFCAAFFTSNVWVPVLISIGGLILFIGLCVCICKACCGSSRSTGVVMHGANPGVAVVNSSNMMQQPGYPNHMMQQPGYPSNSMQQQPGYPMHQPPSYPAQ
ncbi:uncharacterized protein LOC128177130 [Crassostrea angulata]|uniref:uncharacterized protein n=1 Tax=Magallana gigas TaxID=29159 RepID=UPI0022B194A2|nr:uncharacterized protein LOC128168893 [Crassostrea angulata]XP_052691006.1 uncharacterized protein LOC128168893 [Crassostrea angulata]XP_052699656.1 uncharacterized protein LOC128177130 [Crassostrea angulata]XP_052699657.1 uncharacterized protein LOC128177130 [Crassostrea angulata]